MTSDDKLYMLLDRLDNVKTVEGGFQASCPVSGHKNGDKHPSLAVKIGDTGEILVTCWSVQHTYSQVLDAVGLQSVQMRVKTDGREPLHYGTASEPEWVAKLPAYERIELFPTKDGDLTHAVVIRRKPSGKNYGMAYTKQTRDGLDGYVKTWVGDRYLSNLPTLALLNGEIVNITEGGKDADTLTKLGHVATTAPFGASFNWGADNFDCSVLYGKDCVVWADRDEPGRIRVGNIASHLTSHGSTVKVVDFGDGDDGYDVTDWIEDGGTAEELQALIDTAPRWSRSAEQQIADAPSGGRFKLVSASNVKIVNVEWLEENRIPLGSLTVLAGFGGLGKSAWTADLAARITRGDTDGIHAGEPKNVVICSAEDTWQHTIAPRLTAACADMERVYWLAADTTGIDEREPDPAAFSIPADLPAIEGAINAVGDVALVIFDPLVAFIGDDTDTHRDHDTRRALAPLAAMAKRLHGSVLGVMHFNKKSGSDPYQRLSASIAFWNAVRSVLVWGTAPDAEDDSTERVLAVAKMNLDVPAEPIGYRIETVWINDDTIKTMRLVDLGASDVTARDMLAGGKGRDVTKTDEAQRIILDAWDEAQGPVKSADVESLGAVAGISSATMRRARTILKGTSEKRGFDSSTWWYMPPQGHFDSSKAPGEEEMKPSMASEADSVDVPRALPKASRLESVNDVFDEVKPSTKTSQTPKTSSVHTGGGGRLSDSQETVTPSTCPACSQPLGTKGWCVNRDGTGSEPQCVLWGTGPAAVKAWVMIQQAESMFGGIER